MNILENGLNVGVMVLVYLQTSCAHIVQDGGT